MRLIRTFAVLGTLALSAPIVGCAALNNPAPQPSPDQQATIDQSFRAAEAALAAVALVPGVPFAVVQQAQQVLAQLHAVYVTYQTTPNATVLGQLQAAVNQAFAFLATQAAPAVKAAAARAAAQR